MMLVNFVNKIQEMISFNFFKNLLVNYFFSKKKIPSELTTVPISSPITSERVR